MRNLMEELLCVCAKSIESLIPCLFLGVNSVNRKCTTGLTWSVLTLDLASS